MKIVIDTNVLISAAFWGGPPKKVIEATIQSGLNAYATADILTEYEEITAEMIETGKGRFHPGLYTSFLRQLTVIPSVSIVEICRDPDDNKFLSCAKDAQALYIVSGDKDLLSIGTFEGIEIVTVTEFCTRYLRDTAFGG